jgi:hypothetical protein
MNRGKNFSKKDNIKNYLYTGIDPCCALHNRGLCSAVIKKMFWRIYFLHYRPAQEHGAGALSNHHESSL